MTKGKIIGLSLVALATVSTMLHITTKHAVSHGKQTFTEVRSEPTNGLEIPSASDVYPFDVEMTDEGHTTSKGKYTGIQRGNQWILTFRGDIVGAYIDNMLSWDSITGTGTWSAEEHRSGKPGQRASGTTEVSNNPDGTLTLKLLDKSGNEYSNGVIRPMF